MSIDQLSFGSRHLKDRRYDAGQAVLCECGKVTADHTLRERRLCQSLIGQAVNCYDEKDG